MRHHSRKASPLRFRTVATVALVLFVFAGCGDTSGSDDQTSASGVYEGDDGLMLDLAFAPDPPQAGEVDLMIDATVDDEPLEDATIDIEPWMPAHSHGSNTEPVVHHEGDGHYHVDDLTFSMAGQWELRFDVDWDDGDSELIVELEVEG